MTIAFITLGYTPDLLSPSLTQAKELKTVYLYFGAEKGNALEKVNSTLQQFEKLAKSMSVKVVRRMTDDPYDFIGYLKAMSDDIRNERDAGETLDHFNISGGTRPASVAGLLAAAFFGIPAMMRQTRTAEMMDFPLLRSSFTITDNERKIIKAIIHSGESLTQAGLAKELGRTYRSTIHRPVNELIGRNVLFTADDTRDRRKKIIKVNKIIKILLGE